MKLKRPDLILFSILFIAPAVIMSGWIAWRERRLPLPGRVTRHLAPVVRPAHAEGQGAFDAAIFADLIALPQQSKEQYAGMREALASGGAVPPVTIALVRSEKPRIDRILAASRAPYVDAPGYWRLGALYRDPPAVRGDILAQFAAVRVATAATADEAVDDCLDTAGVARDISYGAGILGTTLRKAMLKSIEAPCTRVLRSAPPVLRARALAALQRIEAAALSWPQVMADEGLPQELFDAAAGLSERLRARLPADAKGWGPRADSELWMKAMLLDFWPDLHEAYGQLIKSAANPDAAARKEAARSIPQRWAAHPFNPLGATPMPDYGKFDDYNVEAGAALRRLIEAAR